MPKRSGAVTRFLLRTKRVFHRVIAGWKDTVTPVGACLVVAIVVGAVAGFAWGWSVGFVFACGGAALLALCVPFLLGGHDYRIHVELDRDRVVAGREVFAQLDISNTSDRVSLPGVVEVPLGHTLVETHVPMLSPGTTHRVSLDLNTEKRGIIRMGPITIARGDPVGLLRREVHWPATQTLIVHPVTMAIPTAGAGLVRDLEGLPTNDIVDADLAFHAIREYAPGDAWRNVHWKSTAKTGTLMVRQFEETRHSRIAVLLGIAAENEYASEDEFELAVSAAASIGVQAAREGRDLFLATSAQRPRFSQGELVSLQRLEPRSPTTILDGFAGIYASPEASSLAAVTRLAVRSEPELSVVALVTGSNTEITELRACAMALGPDTDCVVVRAQLGADPVVRRVDSMRVLTIGALPDLGQLIARGALT